MKNNKKAMFGLFDVFNMSVGKTQKHTRRSREMPRKLLESGVG